MDDFMDIIGWVIFIIVIFKGTEIWNFINTQLINNGETDNNFDSDYDENDAYWAIVGEDQRIDKIVKQEQKKQLKIDHSAKMIWTRRKLRKSNRN